MVGRCRLIHSDQRLYPLLENVRTAPMGAEWLLFFVFNFEIGGYKYAHSSIVPSIELTLPNLK